MGSASKSDAQNDGEELDKISVIGAVICQELGIDSNELEVDTDLRESGLNSLTALMITVRLLEEHGIDLGPGTLKENYSLQLLRKALHRIRPTRSQLISQPETAVTPLLAEELPPVQTRSSVVIEVSPTTAAASDDIVAEVMTIIAAEMEIEQSEFADSVEWANLGLDSIMSLAICGRLREELEMEIESTVFAEYDSVGAFKKHLSQVKISS